MESSGRASHPQHALLDINKPRPGSQLNASKIACNASEGSFGFDTQLVSFVPTPCRSAQRTPGIPALSKKATGEESLRIEAEVQNEESVDVDATISSSKKCDATQWSSRSCIGSAQEFDGDASTFPNKEVSTAVTIPTGSLQPRMFSRMPCEDDHSRVCVRKPFDFSQDCQPRVQTRCPSQSMPSVCIDASHQVGGNPICTGELLVFGDTSQGPEPCSILIFSNGFYLVRRDTGQVQSFAWAPFSVVREGPMAPAKTSEALQIFSVCIPTYQKQLLFATSGENAHVQRCKWLRKLSRSLGSAMRSFFPASAISVEPLESAPCTVTRLLAGHLLLRGDDATAFSPYCELRAPFQGPATLAVYSCERCEKCMFTIEIAPETPILEQDGIGNTCFNICTKRFCARSVLERNVWIWAFKFVQEELHGTSRNWTAKDFNCFRELVLERLVQLELLQAADRLNTGSDGARNGDRFHEFQQHQFCIQAPAGGSKLHAGVTQTSPCEIQVPITKFGPPSRFQDEGQCDHNAHDSSSYGNRACNSPPRARCLVSCAVEHPCRGVFQRMHDFAEQVFSTPEYSSL